jgi:methylthioribulose-1-phosphate dehydratase
MSPTLSEASSRLVEVGRRFYDRGWVLGTSGNFSLVVGQEPLRLAVTASGAHKGRLGPHEILVIGAGGLPEGDPAIQPSNECLLHLEVARTRGAGAVLHTHSVWSTLLSEQHAPEGGLTIEGYEMLKGLEGVRTHEHREWVPIVENTQDPAVLVRRVSQALSAHPAAHGFLIRRHGLYTWGADLVQAERHVEIFEFLLEAIGRARTLGQPAHRGLARTREV